MSHSAFTWGDGHEFRDHHRDCPNAGGSGPWLHAAALYVLALGIVAVALLMKGMTP